MNKIDFDTFKQYGIVPSHAEPSELPEPVRDEDTDESSPYRHDWPEMPLGVSRG